MGRLPGLPPSLKIPVAAGSHFTQIWRAEEIRSGYVSFSFNDESNLKC